MDDDQSLTIYLKLVTTEADRQDQQQHARFRQRMKETAAQQNKIDQDQNTERQKLLRQLENTIRRRYQEETKAAQQTATSNIRFWEDETARRKRQLQDLQSAIKARFDTENRLAKQTADLNIGITNNEANQRKQQLAGLRASIKARYDEEKRFAKEYADYETQLGTQSANLRKGLLDNETVQRQQQLGELKKAIAARYDLEDQRARQSVQVGKTMAQQDTNDRKKQVADLRNAIIARYADQDKKAKESADRVVRLEKASAEGAKEHESAILNVAQAYTTLRIVALGSQAITAFWQSLAESAREADNYINRIVDNMEDLRKMIRELSALRGEQATSGATAALGARATVNAVPIPYQMGYEKGLQTEAGALIGPGGIISEEQMEKVTQTVVPYSYKHGTSEQAAAEFIGGILPKMPRGPDGQVDPQALITMYGKGIKGVERARGDTSKDLPQFKEFIAEEVDPNNLKDLSVEEAIAYMSAMTTRNPKSGSAYGRAGMRAIRQLKPDEAQELGIDRVGMTKLQRLDQFIKMAEKHEGFESTEDFLTKYAPDTRQYGAFSALLKGGREEMTRSMASMEAVTPATIAKETIQGKAGEEGKTQAQLSEKTTREMEQAGKFVALRVLQRNAQIALAGNPDLTKPLPWYLAPMQRAQGWYHDISREKQEENMLVGEDLVRKLAGYAKGREFLRSRMNWGPKLSNDRQLQDYFQEQTGAAATDIFGGRFATQDKLGEAANQLEELRKQTRIMQKNRDSVVPPAHIPQFVATYFR